MHVALVPGLLEGVRGGSAKDRRAWALASPLHRGDLISLRAMEQGLEQERRVPGAQVAADLAPGDAPGESVIELKAKAAPPFAGSVSVNNYAGQTVGRWQGSAQLSADDILGLNEILSGWYNSRLSSPSLPANSTGTGASLTIPHGWWTFGLAASSSRYAQTVQGSVSDFTSSNRLASVAATIERVLHRDRTSKTSLQLQVQRRWGNSYIDGLDIALQRQDLADIQLALLDRRQMGSIHLESQLAVRHGVGLFGAQSDPPGLPASLPTARYTITSLDMAMTTPLAGPWSYRGAFHGQFSDRALYSPDQIAAGGAFTVRGYNSDQAILGRSGYYLRQEVSYRLSPILSPYALLDTGQVWGSSASPTGLGAGLRAAWKGFSLDAWTAVPLVETSLFGAHRVKFGLSAGFGF
jgi:hemolysin activation/secretion protein